MVVISVQDKFLCNNITEGFIFLRYNRGIIKFGRGKNIGKKSGKYR